MDNSFPTRSCALTVGRLRLRANPEAGYWTYLSRFSLLPRQGDTRNESFAVCDPQRETFWRSCLYSSWSPRELRFVPITCHLYPGLFPAGPLIRGFLRSPKHRKTLMADIVAYRHIGKCQTRYHADEVRSSMADYNRRRAGHCPDGIYYQYGIPIQPKRIM